MKKMNKKAFTLVELLVVIAILAILATVSIVGYTSFTGKAQESVCLQEATQLRDVIIADDINNDQVEIKNGKLVFATKYVVESKEVGKSVKGLYVKASAEAADSTYEACADSAVAEAGKVYAHLYGAEDYASIVLGGLNGKIGLDTNGFLTFTHENGKVATIDFVNGITVA